MTALLRTLIVFPVLLAAGAHGADFGPVAGAYVFGHEVRSFQPCGSSKLYWVKPDDAELGALLRKHHRELGTQPFGRIFVIVSALVSSEKTTGFAQSYDAYFEISKVFEAAGRIPKDCVIH